MADHLPAEPFSSALYRSRFPPIEVGDTDFVEMRDAAVHLRSSLFRVRLIMPMGRLQAATCGERTGVTRESLERELALRSTLNGKFEACLRTIGNLISF